MKISKSFFLSACLIAGFLLIPQLSIAADTIPVPIPKDGTPGDPPTHPDGMTQELSASAAISDTELAVFFENSVGDATITVYDAYDEIVYQETVDTYTTSEVYIPVGTWDSGIYTITVSYGTTTQRGSFAL
jgi:hypothetical protein